MRDRFLHWHVVIGDQSLLVVVFVVSLDLLLDNIRTCSCSDVPNNLWCFTTGSFWPGSAGSAVWNSRKYCVGTQSFTSATKSSPKAFQMTSLSTLSDDELIAQ